MKCEIEWQCPRCGHHKYTSYIIAYFGEFNREDIPTPGSHDVPYPMRLYACDKCTSTFTDPFLFNNILNLNYNAESLITDCFREGYEKKLDIKTIHNNIKQKLKNLEKEHNESYSKRKEKR